MSVLKSLPIDVILKRGSITDTDVALLRRAYGEDGQLGADDADTLLIINDVCLAQNPAWTELLVEMLGDYVVHQSRPEGYMTAANAVWLMSRISTEGRVGTHSEFELLLNVLAKARWVPVSLVRFGLDQVRHAVSESRGPLRIGQTHPAGTITDKDVEIVRGLLQAFGGGNIPITCPEAEALFEINDAIAAGAPNPAWTGLFIKAIANAMMAVSDYAVPTRQACLRADDGKSTDAVRASYREQSLEEQGLARLEHQRIEIITNEKIAAIDTTWLAERIGRNGRLSPNEHLLLLHIAELGTRLHPALQALLKRCSRAA